MEPPSLRILSLSSRAAQHALTPLHAWPGAGTVNHRWSWPTPALGKLVPEVEMGDRKLPQEEKMALYGSLGGVSVPWQES